MILEIKARIAFLHIANGDIIKEMEIRGENVLPGDFSAFINGRIKTPKAYRVTTLADQILTEWEADKTKIRRD